MAKFLTRKRGSGGGAEVETKLKRQAAHRLREQRAKPAAAKQPAQGLFTASHRRATVS